MGWRRYHRLPSIVYRLTKSGIPSLFFPIDRHWNEAGQALAGEELAAWVQSLGRD